MKNQVGWILFLIGFFGAILLGILQNTNTVPEWKFIPYALIVIGLIIGLMNITDSESNGLMIAALVFGGASSLLLLIPSVGPLLENIFGKLALFGLSIAIPVAVVKLWKVAKN